MNKVIMAEDRASFGIGNWVLFFLGALLVLFNFFVSVTILPLYVLELGGSEFTSGLQATLFFLMAVLLRVYFGPLADRRGRKLPLMMGAFVFATAPLLFLASTTIISLTFARLYQAIGLATFLSSASSLVADMAPPAKTGSYREIPCPHQRFPSDRAGCSPCCYWVERV